MLKDQKELLSVFNAHSVVYLVVGGHAAIAYGVARLTKHLDLWISGSVANSQAAFRALAEFGAPLTNMSPHDFQGETNQVLQLGVPPNRIDILQSVSALSFEEAWANHVDLPIEEGEIAHYLSVEDLIRNKESVGRPQDIADVDQIRRMRELS